MSFIRWVCLVSALWFATDARAEAPTAANALALSQRWIEALVRHDFDDASAMMSASAIVNAGASTSKDARKQLEDVFAGRDAAMWRPERRSGSFDAKRDVDWSTYTSEFLDDERTNRYLRGPGVAAYRAALGSVRALSGDVFLIQARVPPCKTHSGCSWHAFLIVIVPGTNGLEVKGFVAMGYFDS